MYYYKVFDENEQLLGVASSLHLRYYNPKVGKMLCCHEDKAQFIYLDDEHIYRVYFTNEENEMTDKFSPVNLHMATEEEYIKYMAEMAKERSEQK